MSLNDFRRKILYDSFKKTDLILPPLVSFEFFSVPLVDSCQICELIRPEVPLPQIQRVIIRAEDAIETFQVLLVV